MLKVHFKVKIKRLNDLAKIPTKGSEDAAGYDVYCAEAEKITIAPQRMAMIKTGLAFELPKETFLGIYSRSGLSTKKGLRPANCTAVIDSDYRGPVMVPLYNDSNEYMTVMPGERIAQFIIHQKFDMDFIECDELSETSRGEGGFGSTGK
jgi:dUTP diphosphatase